MTEPPSPDEILRGGNSPVLADKARDSFRACPMCVWRRIRCERFEGRISFPVFALACGPCGDCRRWLIAEDGVLGAGLLTLRERSRHIGG